MGSTCLKDAFEAFWRRRYGVDGGLTPSTAPHLDCLDPRGQATAQSVEHSLAQCRERMAGLRQRIRDEEYLEEFLSGVLRDGQALLVGSTDGLPKSGMTNIAAKFHLIGPKLDLTSILLVANFTMMRRPKCSNDESRLMIV